MATVETRQYDDGRAVHRVRFRRGTNPKTDEPIQTSETFTVRSKAERFAKLVDAVGPREALDRLYAIAQSEDVPTLNVVAADHIRLLTGIEEGTRLDHTRLWART